jgi:hypothetical protein
MEGRHKVSVGKGAGGSIGDGGQLSEPLFRLLECLSALGDRFSFTCGVNVAEPNGLGSRGKPLPGDHHSTKHPYSRP